MKQRKFIFIYIVAILLTFCGLYNDFIVPTGTVFAQEQSAVSISQTKITLIAGTTFRLKINGASDKVKWKVNRSSIARVSSNGLVKGVNKGVTTVIATVNDVSYKCTVRVETPSLSKTSIVGTTQSKSTITLKDNTQPVTWSSSNPKIAQISNQGTITWIENGEVIFTAKIGKTVYQCKGLCISNAKVAKKINEVIANEIEPEMKEVEKIRAIHDYLVKNSKYDYENYQSDTIPEASYHPEGVLLKGIGVCQSYAEAFDLFMKALNIPSNIMVGTTEGIGHAWNQVFLEDGWYQVDCTWDDPVPDETGRVLYNYFLINDEQMRNDHIWNRTQYEACTGMKYLTYILEQQIKEYESQGLIVLDADEFANVYAKLYTQDNNDITLLYPNNDGNKDNELINNITKVLCPVGSIDCSYYSSYELGDYRVFRVIINKLELY